MNPPTVALFILATLVLYVGITRIIMEGGLLFSRAPLVGQTFVGYALGPHATAQSNIAMGLSYGWHHELKGFFMVAAGQQRQSVQQHPWQSSLAELFHPSLRAR